MQRPSARGVPFFFIRVDRAGNISKRQSATHFHFSKIGGTCPLWNVYEAFAQPGRIVPQVARMPDGRAYLWVARTVARRAERLVVALAAEEEVNPAVIRYLNRLSDHLFVLARRLNGNGAGDVLWVPGATRG